MESLKISESRLTSGLFKERETLDRDYLFSLDNRALLQNFYNEAGIMLPGLQVMSDPESSYMHWGWEAPTCQLRGHFLGHWLSASAYLVAENKDRELEAKLYTIIDELRICQENNGGKWIGSIPEKYFKRLEEDKYVWSPQYTLHKTLMGLLDAYVCTGYEPAMTILDNAADWYIDWTRSLKDKPRIVLKGEAGGMLEIWARLYQLTKDEKYRELADAYYYGEFDSYLEGHDRLTDNHANASIPQSHGAARMYEVTGDEKWLKIIKEFWKQAVHDREAYATGGHNAGEFWIPPMKFYSAMSERTQEFCTMYNMVRLAEYLYRFTGEREYQDYIEHILYNAFLTQQNKYTGMPTYFLPMAPGSRKSWSSKTRDFWCCSGTMAQAQVLYPTLIYYKHETNNLLSIEQYINSAASFELGGGKVNISLDTEMDYCQGALFGENNGIDNKSRWSFCITVNTEKEINIRFRIPSWASECYVDGNKITDEVDAVNGYYTLSGKFENRKIKIRFVSVLREAGLSDNKNITAIVDGPVVLASVGDEGKNFSLQGKAPKEVLTPFVEHTYDTYPWQQSSYRSCTDNGRTLLVPLYNITDESYTIYFEK